MSCFKGMTWLLYTSPWTHFKSPVHSPIYLVCAQFENLSSYQIFQQLHCKLRNRDMYLIFFWLINQDFCPHLCLLFVTQLIMLGHLCDCVVSFSNGSIVTAFIQKPGEAASLFICQVTSNPQHRRGLHILPSCLKILATSVPIQQGCG